MLWLLAAMANSAVAPVTWRYRQRNSRTFNFCTIVAGSDGTAHRHVLDWRSCLPSGTQRELEGSALDVKQEVIFVLDRVLSLRGRAHSLQASSPLLGDIPEL